MLTLEKKDFKDYVKNLRTTNTKFIIDSKRTVSSLIMGGKYFALLKNKNHTAKNENKREMLTLMSQVSKNVTKFIINNGYTVERIPQRHPSLDTNRIKYSEMKVGDEFFYVDISHCFWRIAYLKKYITPKLYENTLKKPELKTFRNMSLACIVASRKREYVENGITVLEITEERGVFKTLYDNIRFICYNTMGDLAREVPNHFVAYRTDGIMVTKPALKKVKDSLKESGFDYTVISCLKLDDDYYHYSKDKKPKKL